MVANKFLEDVELDDHVRSETVVMCKHFHESVRLMSEQYYAELVRYNYVTPTSYLELILTFKKLLALKRDDIQMLRNRYVRDLRNSSLPPHRYVTALYQLLLKLSHYYLCTCTATRRTRDVNLCRWLVGWLVGGSISGSVGR